MAVADLKLPFLDYFTRPRRMSLLCCSPFQGKEELNEKGRAVFHLFYTSKLIFGHQLVQRNSLSFIQISFINFIIIELYKSYLFVCKKISFILENHEDIKSQFNILN